MSATKCPRCGEPLSSLDAKSNARLKCVACGAAYRTNLKSSKKTGDSKQRGTEDTSQTDATSIRKLARFELKRMLGRGGFGKVFLAYDPLLDRNVAIKIPTFSHKDRRRVARFRAEASMAALLRHPNIVQTFESGESNNTLYIVYQYVKGSPLTQYLAKEELDFTQISVCVESIARALHYAHEHGIVHRDIKPDNVLIDQSGDPQIMDFGLAKQEGRKGVTQDGAIVGTISYMSPEQARGEDEIVTARSDQYSLGAILYEALCGSKPYEGASHVVLTKLADPQTEPSRPIARRGSIPKDLDVICLKAMSNQVSDRYPSCEEFADDLQRWRNDLPITARRSSISERTLRFCRRNPVVSTLTASLAIALALSVGVQAKNIQLGRTNSALTLKNNDLLQDNADLEKDNADLEKDNAYEESENTRLKQQTKELENKKILAEESNREAVDQEQKAVEKQQEAEENKRKAEVDLKMAEALLKKEKANLSAAKKQNDLLRYQSQLQLAWQNITRRNYPQAQLALEKCHPNLRDQWEWQFLKSRSSREIWTRSFDGEVLAHLWLPNTNNARPSQLAVLTQNGLEVVDARTGESGPDATLLAGQFSPQSITPPPFVPIPPSVRWPALKTDPDNKFLSLTNQEQDGVYRVRVWDLATGEALYDQMDQEVAFTDKTNAVLIAKNGVSGVLSTDTWDATPSAGSIQVVRHFLLRYNLEGYVEFPERDVELGSKFCKNRNFVGVQRRDLGESKYVELSGNRAFVLSIRYDDNDWKLVRISRFYNPARKTNRDATDPRDYVEIKGGEPDPAGKYCLSFDGMHVAAIQDEEAYLYDGDSGDVLAVVGRATDIAFVSLEDESALLTVNEKQVDLFSLSPCEETVELSRKKLSVAFSPKSGLLATVDSDGFLSTLSRNKNGKYRTLSPTLSSKEEVSSKEEDSTLAEVQYSNDGERMITRSATTAYIQFPDRSSDLVQTVRLTGNGRHREKVARLRLLPGGDDFLTVYEDGTVVAWRCENGATLPIPLSHEAADFVPDGDAFWIDDRRILCTTVRRKTDVGSENQCPIWNVDSGEIESWWPFTNAVLQTNADQTRLFVGTANGSLEIYRIEKQDAAIHFINESAGSVQLFNGPVRAFAIHPHSNRLFAAGDWQLKVTDSISGSELTSINSPIGKIKDLTISGDGKDIAACGEQKGIWLLQLDRTPATQQN